jgi:hypothetical protein
MSYALDAVDNRLLATDGSGVTKSFGYDGAV